MSVWRGRNSPRWPKASLTKIWAVRCDSSAGSGQLQLELLQLLSGVPIVAETTTVVGRDGFLPEEA
jgi:hypothetical protein